MTTGEWTGTMNLTEPHCGTDLGLIKTKAVPQADGSYAITGQKIFISAGEHDLADNIIHLVLARIEGAPAGVKGISLFVVPKFLPDANGAPGERNGVVCGSLEHKMGIHGNATAVLNYDERQGLARRRGASRPAGDVRDDERRPPRRRRPGPGALRGRLSERRRLREGAPPGPLAERSGRAGQARRPPARPSRRAPHAARDPGVQRGGARALLVSVALTQEEALTSPDPKVRQAADDRLGLMTPVIKGVFTDIGFANAVKAQQVFGGHGYIAQSGMEQFVRDARIAMIYEGANGVQALDLVGRKLPKDGGRAVMAFFGEVGQFLAANKEDAALAPYLAGVQTALGHLQQATMWLMKNGLADPNNAGAASNDYMHLFGLDRARLHVGADRQGGARAAGEGREQPGARREIDARQVLRRAYAAGDGGASGAPDRRRGDGDGAAGGGVLKAAKRRARRSDERTRRRLA